MLPKVLKNFNLFVDGRGYAGRVQEVTLPKLALKTEEFQMGGLDTPVQIDVGMEKLESEFTLSEYDPFVIKMFGIADNSFLPIPFRGVAEPIVDKLDEVLDRVGLRDAISNGQIAFTLRGGLGDEIENKTIPVVVHYEGSVIELDFGQWKAGENAPLRIRLALRYYRLTMNGEELVEIDVDNRVRKFNGDDQIGIGRLF